MVCVTYLDPPPLPSELPPRLPSPFAATPHPVARRAAKLLQLQLQAGVLPDDTFACKRGGKMFGVLVVADAEGRTGFIKSFSGMVQKSWHIDGFVGPVFDVAARDAVWPAGLLALADFDRRLDELTVQSDKQALARQKADCSRHLLEQLFVGYQLQNARGEIRSLRHIFAPQAPPGGAADCAAPKLFNHARMMRLRPLALAEFWWGTSAGGRTCGAYYPACNDKCGPVLGHMLQGLDVDDVDVLTSALVT